MEADVGAYLQSWATELKSRADRVRQLIGDAHWLSDGHHKEYLLREFLSRHLSPGLSVARGFVRPPDQEISCSPEIDILISDPVRHFPFFNEGGLVITPPAGVVGFVETKTTFAKATLQDAISNQVRTYITISTYIANACGLWRGTIFATVPPSISLDSAITTIAESIQDVAADNADLDSCSLPKCIASFDRFFFLLAPTDDNRYEIRGWDLGKLSAACFLAELMSGVSCYQSNRPPRDFEDILANMTVGSIVRSEGLRR